MNVSSCGMPKGDFGRGSNCLSHNSISDSACHICSSTGSTVVVGDGSCAGSWGSNIAGVSSGGGDSSSGGVGNILVGRLLIAGGVGVFIVGVGGDLDRVGGNIALTG